MGGAGHGRVGRGTAGGYVLPLMGCRQGGVTGQAEGLTPLAPATGPEASSTKPLCRGFTSVPWRAVQQPPFPWWWCPIGSGRRALAGWVITMVPGSDRFPLVAPGGRDCYFTPPPFTESKLKLEEVADLGGGPHSRQMGAGTAGTQTQGPSSTGCPAVSQPQRPKAALPHCLGLHSLTLAERGCREEHGQCTPRGYPDSLCKGQQLRQQPSGGAGAGVGGQGQHQPRPSEASTARSCQGSSQGCPQGPLCEQCLLGTQAGGQGCRTRKQCLPKGCS